MQSVTIKCLSFNDLNYSVPSTVEEFDKLAQRSGAALDEANKNVLYRAVLNQARYGFLHGIDEDKETGADKIVGLEEATGIERRTKVTKPEVKDAEGKITQEEVTAWAETESDFEDRVYATLVKDGKFPSIEAAAASYRSLMQDVLNALPFDPKKQERQAAGPKKTPKTYYGIADSLIERCGEGKTIAEITAAGLLETCVADAVERFNKKNPTGQVASEATRDALAKAIWLDQVASKKSIADRYAS